MILAAAAILGLLVSLIRFRGRALGRIAAIPLRVAWLAILAVVLQLPLLRAPAGPPQELGLQQVLFLGSHLLLLTFVWYNRRLAGVLIVGAGLICNLLVIGLNGGFMPITPETLTVINPETSVDTWPEDMHYGYSKDVILARERTRLWALSDVLAIPPPFPRPTAFSVGDLVIAAGIVVLMQGVSEEPESAGGEAKPA
jgi:hypothetical protein